ncbi:unnamed protein product [Mytilus coruscus]|uniref:Integrase zinc-binding domain-containing protein n=1 Tax=Mytilus coruscus TaxID=42192 RepID=A0A6J8DHE8_MYTCO|nr:unnamed protein product [Mytilus coruscus]
MEFRSWRTDHGALSWKTVRWLEILASYNFTIQHRPGRQHNNADGLSPRPCSPCIYCTRQESEDRENTKKDDTEHVRVTKRATEEPKIFDTEEIDIEDNTDSFEWVQSRSSEEISTAQQSHTVLWQDYVIQWCRQCKRRQNHLKPQKPRTNEAIPGGGTFRTGGH